MVKKERRDRNFAKPTTVKCQREIPAKEGNRRELVSFVTDKTNKQTNKPNNKEKECFSTLDDTILEHIPASTTRVNDLTPKRAVSLTVST